MKLLVLLLILKLYTPIIIIFKLTEEKYGQNTITLARYIKRQHRKLSKLKGDIDYLLQCNRHNLMPAFARAKITIQISNYLRNKISRTQINTNQNKLKDRIRFMFYIAFASKMGKSIRKKKKQWTETHKKNLDIYLKHNKTTKVKTRFTEKMIDNFSNYALSEEEKQALSYSLDEYIPVKLNKNKIETEFESFYYNIMQHTGHLRQSEQIS